MARRRRARRPGGRITRNEGYAISQRKRPFIEKVFGRLKPVGGLAKVKLRGWKRRRGCLRSRRVADPETGSRGVTERSASGR
jgi:hypothetical protein